MIKTKNLLICVLLIMICAIPAAARKSVKMSKKPTLERDGYIVIDNILDIVQIKEIQNLWDNREFKAIDILVKNHPRVNEFLARVLPKEYGFMDYVMFLEKSVLHTCHRDNNASRFNTGISKSYTMLVYIDDMKNCLDVVPRSHKPINIGLYWYDMTQTYKCRPGSVILFDADLVHSGSLDSLDQNRRIQFKISHQDDFEKLSFFNDYHKVVDKPNTNSEWSKKIQKNLSCQFPYIADLTQGQNKGYIKGDLSLTDKIFSKLMYSDPNYYSLQDAY